MARAKSPLETVLTSWNQRRQQAQQLGIPDKAYARIAQKDISNVLAGGTPMPNDQVSLSILSGATGKPVIQTPGRKTGLSHILGNVPGDVSDIVRGFNPVNIVQSLSREGVAAGQMLSGSAPNPFSDVHDPGGELRALAATPIIHMIPGITTAGALTSGEGRKSLQQHPVGTLLDVFPGASKLGKLASAGRIAEEGSALESLQRGNPIKAAGRAVSERIPLGADRNLRTVTNDMAQGLGISQDIREQLSRPYSHLTRKGAHDMVKLWRDQLAPTFQAMSTEERAQLFDEARRYNPADTTISLQHHAILQHVRQITEDMGKQGAQSGSLVSVPIGEGKHAWYPVDDPVSESLGKVRSQTRRLDQANETLTRRQTELTNALAKQTGKLGKVRRFMESEHDFSTRPEHPVSIQSVRDALQPFTESFQHLDPRKVFTEYLNKIADGDVRRAVATRLGKDFQTLQGEGGLVAQLDESLQRGDVRSAQKSATKIARIFKHKGWDDFATTTSLRTYMSHIRDELIGLSGKERTHGYAARLVHNAETRLKTAAAKVETHATELSKRQATFAERLNNRPAASYHGLIEDRIRSGALDQARLIHQGANLDSAIRSINESPRMQDLAAAIGSDEFEAIKADAITNWRDLVRAGYDPVWMHHVEPDRVTRIMYPKPLPDKLMEPGMWETKLFNFAPGVHDIVAAVMDGARQIIAKKATEQFITVHVMPFAKPVSEIEPSFRDMVPRSALTSAETVAGRAKSLMSKEWTPFDPARYGVGSFDPNVSNANELVIPKHIDRALNLMMRDYNVLPLRGAFDKVTQLYKFSVLTGPRHLVHVGLGGMMFAMLREPTSITHIVEAAKQVREGTAPIELMQKLYDGMETDQIFHYATGKSMASHFVQAVGDKVKALARVEEFMANVERTSVYLSSEARGLSRDEALHSAYKTFVDMDGMAPIERTIVKQIFPFYAFTRHLFRYLFTYPVDHPIRAAVLSRFSEQEQQDWKSGLPAKYQQLFWLGQPDKNGNVTTIDVKSLNPFRSFGNDFTLAGFLSSLHPVVTAGFEAAGVNTLSATTDLYPQISYDPVSGTLVSKRVDTGPKILNAIIPEFGAVDHFVGITQRMKQMKKTNPEAYRRALFSSLNIPFEFGPMNVPYETQKAQLNRYKAAQAAVSAGTKSGDLSEAMRYNLVPYQGQIVPPAAIQALIQSIERQLTAAGLTNISPKAVMTRPRTRKRGR